VYGVHQYQKPPLKKEALIETSAMEKGRAVKAAAHMSTTME
jgi:hypothetical protein